MGRDGHEPGHGAEGQGLGRWRLGGGQSGTEANGRRSALVVRGRSGIWIKALQLSVGCLGL